MHATDIGWGQLAFGFLTLALPIAVLAYYNTGLVKATIISFLRMALQLGFVGFYLKFIFQLNSPIVNFAWVAFMAIAASNVIARRSELRQRAFLLPIAGAIAINLAFNSIVFYFLMYGYADFFDARYVIPILGMIIGNNLSSCVVGVRSFYQNLKQNEENYRFQALSGATKSEALFGLVSKALKDSVAPSVASTATIGLIWLPGMMTGQILGGSDPLTAIKYQILIMVAVFVGNVLTVFSSLKFTKNIAFDEFDAFKTDIFVGK
ncbi:MAG: ABC transporter permease [Chloroflexota bacterium]